MKFCLDLGKAFTETLKMLQETNGEERIGIIDSRKKLNQPIRHGYKRLVFMSKQKHSRCSGRGNRRRNREKHVKSLQYDSDIDPVVILTGFVR